MTGGAVIRRLADRLRARPLSAKERLQLLVLLSLLSLWGAGASFDRADAARADAIAARSELGLQQQRGFAAVGEGDRELERSFDAIRENALPDATVSLAVLHAQSELEDFAIASGVGDVRISADEPERLPGGMQRLSIVVEGSFGWEPFGRFLAALETARASYFPVSVEVFDSSTAPKFSMIVEAAYLEPGSGT